MFVFTRTPNAMDGRNLQVIFRKKKKKIKRWLNNGCVYPTEYSVWSRHYGISYRIARRWWIPRQLASVNTFRGSTHKSTHVDLRSRSVVVVTTGSENLPSGIVCVSSGWLQEPLTRHTNVLILWSTLAAVLSSFAIIPSPLRVFDLHSLYSIIISKTYATNGYYCRQTPTRAWGWRTNVTRTIAYIAQFTKWLQYVSHERKQFQN